MHLKFVLIILIISPIISCGGNSNSNQPKQTTTQDTVLLQQALSYRIQLVNKFHDTIPSRLDSNYYYLIYYSSLDKGMSIKFTHKSNRYFLTVKTLTPQDSIPRQTEFTTEINEAEWDKLDDMINDFDFWDAEQLKMRKTLDGHTYYLEGSRITNSGRQHKLISRHSPQYDKIGALCDYILQYQEELVFQYRQKDNESVERN